jgi:hypothetical protein
MEDASSSSCGDVDRYTIIRKLTDSIFNTKQELHTTTPRILHFPHNMRPQEQKEYRKTTHCNLTGQ